MRAPRLVVCRLLDFHLEIRQIERHLLHLRGEKVSFSPQPLDLLRPLYATDCSHRRWADRRVTGYLGAKALDISKSLRGCYPCEASERHGAPTVRSDIAEIGGQNGSETLPGVRHA